MKKIIVASAAMAMFGMPVLTADNIPNPLLPNVADIGVMKYNGKYYLGGCRTDGDFYISSDLINWEGPIHVIDMENEWSKGSGCGNNQIHANDMLYDNGTVHAYWSVNYWGNDLHAVHVVHSEASDPMGPYSEPVKDRWMDNRIDPKVFRDDDGKMYMYMVRFTDGNTIWARKMKNWREFDETDPDQFVCQFSSNPNTWERMDNAVAEGPWVIKYHGQYYLMYNANHTGGEWGNYQLGVAQSRTPMGFNNANKYPHPVVLSNQKELEDNYVDLLRFSTGTYSPLFSYSTTPPVDGWTAADFNDRNWAKGIGGFARGTVKGTTTYRRGTNWDTEKIWLRKGFNLSDLNHNLALRLTTKGPAKIYLNGNEIHTEDKGVYRIINFTPEMSKSLKLGGNVLAIECQAPTRGGGYVNAELFDMGSGMADPEIVWTPGQPNILRGPNGLEWWLIYMANNNGLVRSQYVDRVHFHGDKLVVDGISHANNPGYHPTPALPAYSDTFDKPVDMKNWASLDGAMWSVGNSELQGAPGSSAVLAPSLASPSYLWEVNVKPEDTAGVYALWIDDANNVKILFDKSANAWTVVETVGGKTNTLGTNPLRDDFKWGVYHQIRVERDHADLIVSIDEMRVADPYVTALDASAVPGLVTTGKAAFDGIIYTIGFDDGNDRMNGWEMAEGTLVPTERGAKASGVMKAFKGIPSENYEFTTQVSGLKDGTCAGFYPLYVDQANYVEAVLDEQDRALKVTTVRKGKVVDTQSLPLDFMRTLYADMRFTDSFDKGYTMDCPTVFDEIYLKRYDVANRNVFSDSRFDKETATIGDKEIFVDNMFSLMEPAMLEADGSWSVIPTENASVAQNPAYNVVSFEPMKGSRLRFINRIPTDGGHHIYDIRLHELFKESYNLRVVRDGDILHLFVDGRDMAELPVKGFGEAIVGLNSHQGSPEFHGLTYYHK
ncbi:MAG: family 43 glycosylhydrolase [Bacteroidales bacterium]|nr:family 43 glycosylhydrolase [Bacteroidales bacterium]